jgi:protocatechuate 3,4-dioxygenase, alpha subunit
MNMFKQTPSQTIGPFFHMGIPRGIENNLVDEKTTGERICITGQVLDGEGKPIPDALIEIWQADSGGHFNHSFDPNEEQADQHFHGFGRSDTLKNGRFSFQTVKPGTVPDPNGKMQAPHINARVFARGMLIHAVTRIYFQGEPANETDAVLNSIDDVARRQTLIAALEKTGVIPTYRFDIRLQGNDETVFFEP